jgi:hypothetical protein
MIPVVVRHSTGVLVTGDDELKHYLQFLLDHSEECREEGCALCLSLNNVCELLRNQIFSGRVFREIMPSATSRASSQQS